MLGELVESAKEYILADPLPSFAAWIAVQGVMVLNKPLHCMYTKFNRFLNKGPVWNIEKLPAYWVTKTFVNAPEVDDCHDTEVEWTLDALIEGLRTEAVCPPPFPQIRSKLYANMVQDVDIYRRCNIFESALSLYNSSFKSRGIRDKVLNLLYRCTLVGGSKTLSTRCGVLSWIAARLTQEGSDEAMLKCLASQIGRTTKNIDSSRWKK